MLSIMLKAYYEILKAKLGYHVHKLHYLRTKAMELIKENKLDAEIHLKTFVSMEDRRKMIANY